MTTDATPPESVRARNVTALPVPLASGYVIEPLGFGPAHPDLDAHLLADGQLVDATPFTPNQKTVDEVLEAMADMDEEQRADVLAAEKKGAKRKMILEHDWETA